MSREDPHFRSFPGLDRSVLREQGYTVIRQLFDPEEVQRLRELALGAVAEAEQQGRLGTEPGAEGTTRGRKGDLLSNPLLRHVLLDPRVLGAVGELLGGEPVYFGDSSFRIGRNGVRVWHRDSVDKVRWRGGHDWYEPYPLLRCGLYLQDQASHSGGLALRPHSNRPGRVLPALPRLVRARPGDLVAWDLRTVHSGEAVRLRGLPRLALNPRLQTRLPERLRVPEDGERIVMFMTFAMAGPHLDNYLAYLKTRDYMHQHWSDSQFGPEVWAEAKLAGLHVLQPVLEYGAQTSSRTAAATCSSSHSVSAGKHGSDRQPA